MNLPIHENRLFFRDANAYSLGRMTLAGSLRASPGTGAKKMRVFGQYAIVLLVNGNGYFRDILGSHHNMKAGDLIFVFPEIAHSYGPNSDSHWDEIYVCFDGEIFDLWRSQNLLNPNYPVVSVGDWRVVLERLVMLLEAQRPTNQKEHLESLHQFLAILGDIVPDATKHRETEWLAQAKAILQSDLHRNLRGEEVAKRVGLTYETLRKSFAKECGCSPAQFRDQQRIEAAQTLLTSTAMTHGAIARSLGFRDEAHFARRFKELVGQAPRDYRNSVVCQK